jgi:hypothetical protein
MYSSSLLVIGRYDTQKDLRGCKVQRVMVVRVNDLRARAGSDASIISRPARQSTITSLPFSIMYDPSTIELALEMGLDPEDFSTGTSDAFADDSGVAFHQRSQYPPQYDDFQDDIGDYMRSLMIKPRVSETLTRKFFPFAPGTSRSSSDSPVFHATASGCLSRY